MAEFKFVKNWDGGEEHYEELPMAAVSIAAGEVVYYVSGYISNATATNITCQNVAGVAGEAIDNTGGGGVGAFNISVLVSPNAIYQSGTTGTAAQSQMGTNVPLTSTVEINEDAPSNTYTGLIHLISLISTSKVFCRINHFSPRA